jgi:hypothetical protein
VRVKGCAQLSVLAPQARGFDPQSLDHCLQLLFPWPIPVWHLGAEPVGLIGAGLEHGISFAL